MKIFISGGCKNGKSTLAEECARAMNPEKLYYIATMIPHDEEDLERIRRHRKERAGKGFETIECGTDILDALNNADKEGSFLLDSVTALLSNEMFKGAEFDKNAGERTAAELKKLAETAENIVFVSDFIYCDAAEYDSYTEAYRKGLALCDRALAEICDTTVEVVNGNCIVYKGKLPVNIYNSTEV